MADEYIHREDAINIAVSYEVKRDGFHLNDYEYGRNQVADSIASDLEDMPPADVIPYSIESDGTLIITVPKGTKRIGRILIEEDGTQYGGLFYPDTGGCFLSSMERSEQDG